MGYRHRTSPKSYPTLGLSFLQITSMYVPHNPRLHSLLQKDLERTKRKCEATGRVHRPFHLCVPIPREPSLHGSKVRCVIAVRSDMELDRGRVGRIVSIPLEAD